MFHSALAAAKEPGSLRVLRAALAAWVFLDGAVAGMVCCPEKGGIPTAVPLKCV